MSAKEMTRDLLKRALDLPRKERGVLVRELVASLDDSEDEDPAEVEKAWAQEIARRIRGIKTGRVKLIPADEVFARLRAAQEKDERKARRQRKRRES